MKRTKLIGATLITSAILLQVGYAASTNVESTISATQNFEVYFADPVVTEASESVEVNVQEQNNTLDIQVKNIYPGAIFGIITQIKNYGEITAKINDVKIEVTSTVGAGRDDSPKSGNVLVGYDEAGNAYIGQSAYTKYLADTYTGYEIHKGSAIPIHFSLGMATEVASLQNEKVDFTIKLDLEQVISPGGGGDGDNQGGGNGSGTDTETPDIDIPDEQLPAGKIPDNGKDNTNQETHEVDQELDIPEEHIPGGNTKEEKPTTTHTETQGILPQTGGVTPTLVYTIGFTLLAGGIIIYNKKED